MRISSFAGGRDLVNSAHYMAAKHLGVVRTMANELGRHRIRVKRRSTRHRPHTHRGQPEHPELDLIRPGAHDNAGRGRSAGHAESLGRRLARTDRYQ